MEGERDERLLQGTDLDAASVEEPHRGAPPGQVQADTVLDQGVAPHLLHRRDHRSADRDLGHDSRRVRIHESLHRATLAHAAKVTSANREAVREERRYETGAVEQAGEVRRAEAAAASLLPPGVEHARSCLLRAGSAAVFDVHGTRNGAALRAVARVEPGREAEAAAEQGSIARALHAHGVRAALPLAGTHPQTAQVEGREYTVTWWEHVEHDPVLRTCGRELGRLAAEISRVPHTGRRLDPLRQLRGWLEELEANGAASREELLLLHEKQEEAAELWEEVKQSPEGLVHGDLVGENVLRTPDGFVVIDLETAGTGPLAWELVKHWGGARFGRPRSEWEEVAAGYEAAGGNVDTSLVARLEPVAVLVGAAFTVARRTSGGGFPAESHVRLRTLRGEEGILWTPQ